MNSIDNIHRRYRHRFTLPSVYLIFILACSTSTLIVLVLNSVGQVPLLSIVLSTSLTLFLFSISIMIEYYLLRNNSLVRLKRLIFISFSSNLLWLFVLAFGLIFSFVLMASLELASIQILGIFVAAALRLFVFKTLFTDTLYKALLLAFIQPLLIGFAALYPSLTHYLIQKPQTYIGGVVIVVSAIIFVILLDRKGERYFKERSLKFMRAFLYAWMARQPDEFEKIIFRTSSEVEVGTNILSFEDGISRPALIMTDVHPGPFYPVGSSNLPYLMYKWFKDRGYSSIILHSMSGHELNIPSKEEVQNFLTSLDSATFVASATVCTVPVIQTIGKSTVMGIAFNDIILLTITLSPHGTDDFPKEVGEKIKELASAMGLKNVTVVDSHNSQGDKPYATDYKDVLDATKQVLKQLKASAQHTFKVGLSHSSEFAFPFQGDIGPAGIGVLALKVNGKMIVIVGVDANNAKLGLREAIIGSLENSGASTVELYTTDTHMTISGRGTDIKGYYALGELTNEDTLTDFINAIMTRAVDRLTESTLTLKVARNSVKVMGMGALDSISLGLDRVLSFARKGALMLFIIFFLTLIFVSFF
jgi:putative membrane protein